MTTGVYHDAEAIAHHYRPGARPESGYFKVPCPAHRGDDNNLHLGDAPDGGLILKCWSADCTFNNILRAIQADGLAVKRAWTYPNGKVVTRIDRGGSKDLGNNPGTTKGVPLLISNDSEDALIVICEGESDRDAVLSAGLPNVAAACFVGGAKMSGQADYSQVKGRRVAHLWPDHDEEGATALLAAALACKAAGAAEIYAVPYVGEPDSKQGAADLSSFGIKLALGADLRKWVEEPEPPIPPCMAGLGRRNPRLATYGMASAWADNRWRIDPTRRRPKSWENPTYSGPTPGHDADREVSRL